MQRECLHLLTESPRQLLAIARVLLRPARIICMDEPTAHVDAVTDAALQHVVRRAFAGATLLTIAHRLNTVLPMDRIVVMRAGVVAEQGAPAELLRAEGSALAGMVGALGAETEASLRKLAAPPELDAKDRYMCNAPHGRCKTLTQSLFDR